MLERIRNQAMVNLGPMENGQEIQLAAATQPKPQAGRRQITNNSANRPATANRTNNSRQSANIPRSRGGGALNPYSALFILAFAGSILVSCNNRK
jgi:hypothetical protein